MESKEANQEERARIKAAIQELDEISYGLYLRNYGVGPLREAVVACLKFVAWCLSVPYTPLEKGH